MSNIDKRALREAAEKATPGKWERGDGNGNGGELHVYCDDALGSAVCEMTSEYNAIPKYQRINNLNFIAAANPDTVLALLDELESAEERYVDILRQARSFREAHDAASEIIRKLERNKPTVKLPTTRLWAGKIACYEESEVVAMLERAGINIDAAGKGEAS